PPGAPQGCPIAPHRSCAGPKPSASRSHELQSLDKGRGGARAFVRTYVKGYARRAHRARTPLKTIAKVFATPRPPCGAGLGVGVTAVLFRSCGACAPIRRAPRATFPARGKA